MLRLQCDPEVVNALTDFYRDSRSFGNPSSSYGLGGLAYDVIDRARRRIAKCLWAEPAEIYFTGSGTEANNLAIKGITGQHESGHIISTNVEHPSVLNTLRLLESEGYDVTYLPVASDGTLSADAVARAIRSDTILGLHNGRQQRDRHHLSDCRNRRNLQGAQGAVPCGRHTGFR